MSQCNRLFRVDAAYAFFDASTKSVVVAADVWMNPYADQVHVCPNPIAMPAGAREFLVEGFTKPGIHPMLVVKNRVSTSFSSDSTPRSVVVYAMGVDAPQRLEVQVASAPPPALQPGTQASEQSTVNVDGAAGGTRTGASGTQVIGRSAAYSFEEAINDALAQAEKLLPSPPRNPDVSVVIEVTKITAQALGSMPPGLVVTATVK
jgi:hypothetical protein